jgi:hypothetical protein
MSPPERDVQKPAVRAATHCIPTGIARAMPPTLTPAHEAALQAAEQSDLSVYGLLVFSALVLRPDLYAEAMTQVLDLPLKDREIIHALAAQDIQEKMGSRSAKQIRRFQKHNSACSGRDAQEDLLKQRLRNKADARALRARQPATATAPPPLETDVN